MARSKRRNSHPDTSKRAKVRVSSPAEKTYSLADASKAFDIIVEQIDAATVDGLSFIEEFKALPSKKALPDYYEIIENPISLHEIRKHVIKNGSLEQLEDDFNQLVTNAQSYNAPGSELYRAAEEISKIVENVLHHSNSAPPTPNAIKGIIDELVSTTEPRKKRILSALFMDIPDKNDYPEYYEIVKTPMAFNSILKKASKYTSWEEFENDVMLIFENAKLFNEESSQVYKDAVTLESKFRNLLENAKASSSSPSATPQPAVKLKLNVKQPKAAPKPGPIIRFKNPKKNSVAAEDEAEDDSEKEENDEEDEDLEEDDDADESKESENADDDDNENDTAGEDHENDAEDSVKEDEDERMRSPSAELPDTKLRPEGENATDALIRQVTIASTPSLLFNAHGRIFTANSFRLQFSASDKYTEQTQILSLPTHLQNMVFTPSLRGSLYSRPFNLFVSHNYRRLSPIVVPGNSDDFVAEDLLQSTYELKLTPGLNLIDCTLSVMPEKADEASKPEKQERFVFWVNFPGAVS
ncbi:hypothetical protein CANCADRAFT_30556 [Tortispora caseinolytica NRRL Y-17796]|uniref:Bromo domain-containing protein n=1 Tax=Tortispora caseinolytica NRRL Y-17796 TaxID=767744 RepID=A0A1E4TKV6_9ASCO|nr:hypothetical protein CANCADRAFT_30556 [Tortispora caseinolytica NRRL Y-17796]